VRSNTWEQLVMETGNVTGTANVNVSSLILDTSSAGTGSTLLGAAGSTAFVRALSVGSGATATLTRALWLLPGYTGEIDSAVTCADVTVDNNATLTLATSVQSLTVLTNGSVSIGAHGVIAQHVSVASNASLIVTDVNASIALAATNFTGTVSVSGSLSVGSNQLTVRNGAFGLASSGVMLTALQSAAAPVTVDTLSAFAGTVNISGVGSAQRSIYTLLTWRTPLGALTNASLVADMPGNVTRLLVQLVEPDRVNVLVTDGSELITVPATLDSTASNASLSLYWAGVPASASDLTVEIDGSATSNYALVGSAQRVELLDVDVSTVGLHSVVLYNTLTNASAANVFNVTDQSVLLPITVQPTVLSAAGGTNVRIAAGYWSGVGNFTCMFDNMTTMAVRAASGSVLVCTAPGAVVGASMVRFAVYHGNTSMIEESLTYVNVSVTAAATAATPLPPAYVQTTTTTTDLPLVTPASVNPLMGGISTFFLALHSGIYLDIAIAVGAFVLLLIVAIVVTICCCVARRRRRRRDAADASVRDPGATQLHVTHQVAARVRACC
jgi:hypothetical protein